jgi:hypothetical protein
MATLEEAAPPAGLSPPRQALWWLAKGGWRLGPEWQRAHRLAQAGEGQRDHDLVHAVVHLVEGDLGNADYWFGRAGQPRLGRDARSEWDRAAAAVA